MKNTLKNSLITIAVIASSLATFAASDNASDKSAYDLPTYTIEDIASLPEPTKSRVPTIKSEFVGLSLQVKFTVNAQGEPESVRLAKPLSSYSDIDKMTFASQLQNAVKNWKFEPAYDVNGNAISVKVIMPVKVVEKNSNVTALASITLDDSKADRS